MLRILKFITTFTSEEEFVYLLKESQYKMHAIVWSYSWLHLRLTQRQLKKKLFTWNVCSFISIRHRNPERESNIFGFHENSIQIYYNVFWVKNSKKLSILLGKVMARVVKKKKKYSLFSTLTYLCMANLRIQII